MQYFITLSSKNHYHFYEPQFWEQENEHTRVHVHVCIQPHTHTHTHTPLQSFLPARCKFGIRTCPRKTIFFLQNLKTHFKTPHFPLSKLEKTKKKSKQTIFKVAGKNMRKSYDILLYKLNAIEYTATELTNVISISFLSNKTIKNG